MQTKTMNIVRHWGAAGVLAALSATSALAQATSGAGRARDAAPPPDPCCAVVSIDAQSGVVTAREISTGFLFRFSVRAFDPGNGRKGAQVRASDFRIGQKVSADFGERRVSMDGITQCCSIVEMAPALRPRAQVAPSGSGRLGAAEGTTAVAVRGRPNQAEERSGGSGSQPPPPTGGGREGTPPAAPQSPDVSVTRIGAVDLVPVTDSGRYVELASRTEWRFAFWARNAGAQRSAPTRIRMVFWYTKTALADPNDPGAWTKHADLSLDVPTLGPGEESRALVTRLLYRGEPVLGGPVAAGAKRYRWEFTTDAGAQQAESSESNNVLRLTTMRAGHDALETGPSGHFH